MKKILLSIIYFLGGILSIQAQTLYTTVNGGGDGGGTIIRFIPATNNLTVLKSLKSNDPANGGSPTGSLVLAGNGKLYGMTQFGGSTNQGVIFSYDPASGNYIKLHDFDGTNGANPSGSLIQASNGLLYGTTQDGDPDGVIFSFDPLSSTFTKLKTFDFINGDEPLGSLMQAGNGKLYGITNNGGSFHEGIIFSFDPLTGTYAILHDFDFDHDGGAPFGNLMQATDGKLYGMTSAGGSNLFGVIFSFDPASSVYTVLKNFAGGIDGASPLGSLIQASDEKLYGMTTNGGDTGYGVIFSYDPSSSTYTVLKLLDNANGGHPDGYFLQASNGKLYGTTEKGGTNGVGVIFSFDPSTSTYTKLQDFDGTNGANPYIGSAFIEVNSCIKPVTYFKDHDGDGYGNPDSSVLVCSQPAGYVTNDSDCNDNNAAIHAPVTYYRDADRDGLGDPNNSINVCETSPPRGYVRNNYDCDDHSREHHVFDERLLMCHNGKEECVKRKFVLIKLFEGWTLGPCTTTTCDRNETLMCHSGKEECVKRTDVLRKLFEGWTLGPCFSRDITSQNTIDFADNAGIYDKEQSIPQQYKLSNYPNPFAGSTTIKYELPFDSKVSIKVYDLMGRVIATLVEEDKKAGTYTIDFKAGRLSSGSLYYRLTAVSKDKQFVQTNKMIELN